ncbi:MAG: S9 family peptidase [Pseudomonadota bacterium]|uniref:S9 family peptidase n=1 Tax=Gallaecimonas pentaromativorans TaxID=584787 RepID=UPI00067F1165|nr:S9 family peptidase [Gallaecimonas pentaromativorans]MED5526266.1 S9 family peptidase [Pseudomonadota bacterium]
MRLIYLTLLGLALTACDSKPPAPQTPRYDAKAFFDTVNYRGLSLSHDGQQVLVSSDISGIFNVFAIPVQGGSPRELTDNPGSTFAVSWFPNDERFLYTRDDGGNEIYHLFVADDAGQHDLIPDPNARAQFLAFNQDGTAFYLLSNERNPKLMDLYRYDATTYQRQRLFNNDQAFEIGAISRDGRFLALDRVNNNSDTDLYLVDLQAADKTPVLIGDLPGENANFRGLTFGPEGHFLYFATDAYGNFNQVWSHHLATGTQEKVAGSDWDVSGFAFSPSGQYRVGSVNADGRTELTVSNARTGKALVLPELPPGDITGVNFSDDDATMVFYLSSDTSPANLYALDLKSGQARALTSALNPAIDAGQLVTAQVVRYPSFDQLQIPALLYRPKGASAEDPAPIIVWVHGGPGGQSRHGYNATLQHLVNHGYGVLAVNNRGSSGYGKPFFHLDDRRHGEDDLRDLVEAKGYLQSLPWVDKDRIGIMGGSYGGYLTVAALAFHPDVFAAGVDIFGVTNWPRTLSAIPPWWESFKSYLYAEMGNPATDGERLRRISPLFHASNINKPLLVVQGLNDPRVLPVESQELVAAVKKNGVAVQYLEFIDEGHGFTKKLNRIAASEAYLRFLDTHLKGQQH